VTASREMSVEFIDELHRKACILQSMIEVVYDRVVASDTDDRDHVVDNLLDAARDLARELPIMALEDPAHWRARK
jgi:hypothetical protein